MKPGWKAYRRDRLQSIGDAGMQISSIAYKTSYKQMAKILCALDAIDDYIQNIQIMADEIRRSMEE